MKILYLLICSIIVISFCSCGREIIQQDNDINNETGVSEKELKFDSQLTEPPNIYFVYDEKEYLTVRGTSSWFIDNEDGTRTGFESDSPGPGDLVKDQEEKLVVNEPYNVNIQFDSIPDKYDIYIWNGYGDIEKVVVENNRITVPNDRVSAIYEIHAFWSQGNAYYAIEVVVE